MKIAEEKDDWKFEIKPAILECPDEGIQMRLSVQLSYQQSSVQPQSVDDLPKAEESKKK